MTQLDYIVFRQLPMVLQIIRDETWLEGERRGCKVFSDDRVVRENVCLVVLRVGAQMREASGRTMVGAPQLIRFTVVPGAA